ncbi:MAG: alanine racemase [Elusimicrobia bacterium]|nr:alanine racemase [Elusimicrobiota bacterium]
MEIKKTSKKNSAHNIPFYRPTWAEIDISNFQYNLKKIKSYLNNGVKIMPVIKASGYGHGGVVLALQAQKIGVECIGVSSIEEGLAFREAGIKTEILVLGSIYPLENLDTAARNNLTPSVSSISGVVALGALAKKLKKRLSFHLAIDTGMGRFGVDPSNAWHILQKISLHPELNMSGMYTHFPVADTNSSYTQSQLDTFAGIVNYARKNGFKFTAHAANSAALIKNKKTHLDMVRPGISLFGLTSFDYSDKTIKLKPVLSWKTKIVFLKRVAAGFCVSYGRTFVTNRASVIATIPVGYADGYSRQFSSKADVLVRGRRCPVAGRVTMDMTMIDVTNVKGVSVGDEVVLLGQQGKERISAEELARLDNTINYEITCKIAARVPRVSI